MSTLSKKELTRLLQAVFPGLAEETNLAILVDVPRRSADDTEVWEQRRQLASEWAATLKEAVTDLGLVSVDLIGYPDVGDLPEFGYVLPGVVPNTTDALVTVGAEKPFTDIFSENQVFLAPTQYSTTAPLKVAAREHGFRAATMPGFSPKMIPALRIDYGAVNRRCQVMKERLDAAEAAHVTFRVDDEVEYEMVFDLRFRPGHASGGRFPDKGMAGNLPSGETYIVPYEGERKEPSGTRGVLPVQFEDEVVLFEIDANVAKSVRGDGVQSKKQAEWLRREPAYGNMAELGFGVLGDFGLLPIGQILLDEKLGFHIAFGRSDHFGGINGPDKFSSPEAVVHIDYIYIPKLQPRVQIASLMLQTGADQTEIIRDGEYVIEDERW